MDYQTVSEHVENTGDGEPEGMPDIKMPDIENSMDERYDSRSGHYMIQSFSVLVLQMIPLQMVLCSPNIIAIKA